MAVRGMFPMLEAVLDHCKRHRKRLSAPKTRGVMVSVVALTDKEIITFLNRDEDTVAH